MIFIVFFIYFIVNMIRSWTIMNNSITITIVVTLNIGVFSLWVTSRTIKINLIEACRLWEGQQHCQCNQDRRCSYGSGFDSSFGSKPGSPRPLISYPRPSLKLNGDLFRAVNNHTIIIKNSTTWRCQEGTLRWKHISWAILSSRMH